MSAPRARHVSVAALASWLALCALQQGLVPAARHAWAFDLWQYLPGWMAWACAAASLALCAGSVREAVARGCDALHTRAPRLRGIAGKLLAFAALALIFWLLRERRLYGDSEILLFETGLGRSFHLKEMGSSFLLGTVVRLARSAELEHAQVVSLVQALISLAGALAVVVLHGVAGRLAPGRAGAALAWILSGGVLRVVAGHVEVYAFSLAALALYLHAALARLEGRGSFAAASLALGLAIWTHLSALLLMPSLLALSWLASRSLRPRDLAVGLALAALPCVLFLAWQLGIGVDGVTGLQRELARTLHGDQGSWSPRLWVRAWGETPTAVTDYAFASRAQLKYLANAAHLLVPGVLPVLLALALRGPRRLLDTPTARFLCAAAAPLAIYPFVLRPIWGPFDWDLFAVSAVVLAALAAHGLAVATAESSWRHLTVWLAGFGLLFVGLPFLLLGIVPAKPAGPFAEEQFSIDITRPGTPAQERIAPWL
ncbi:MAG TPA: hypothetical protein VFY49_08840 [Myxococcota bacterium]|nr:hypothetical protein [Myxococcota bacterium]